MTATDARYPSAAVDVVALLRATSYEQVAAKARAMKATVKEAAKAMDHPLESGATITDHRIILPVEVELSVILASADYRAVYQQIRALFQSSELLIVQTATASYADMMIIDMPHDETPDMVGAVAIALRLKEVKTVKAAYGTLPPRAVVHKADADTVKRGEVAPVKVKPGSSLGHKGVEIIKDAFFSGKK